MTPYLGREPKHRESPRYEVRRCATDEVVTTHPTLAEAELARDLLLHTACPVYITWAY